VNGDEYLQSLWECINVNAVRRLGLSDHGPVHFAIVSNIALKILRNLLEAGVKPNIVTDHRMTDDDAEVKWSTPGSAREDPKNMTPQVARQLRRGTSSYGRLRAGRDVCRVLV